MPGATWQSLPFEFKQNVVSQLDFESRCSLQMCSKADADVVRESPLRIQFFQIVLLVDKATIIISLKFDNSSRIQFKTMNLDEACATLPRVFSNKNMFLESFGIGEGPKRGTEAVVFSQFPRKLLESEFQINCEIYSISAMFDNPLSNKNHNFLFWRLFQRVNPEFLESLLVTSTLSNDELERVVETEQFKVLKMIELTRLAESLRVEKMFGANQIRCKIDKLTTDDTWSLVQNFLHKPYGAFFDVHTCYKTDLTGWLKKFGDQREPRKAEDDPEVLHSQTFDMKHGRNLVLIVDFYKYLVKGIVLLKT